MEAQDWHQVEAKIRADWVFSSSAFWHEFSDTEYKDVARKSAVAPIGDAGLAPNGGEDQG